MATITKPDSPEDLSVLLLIQGRMRPYAAAAYQAYVEGTGRLIPKYSGEVLTSGGGIDSEYTTDDWPINAVIRFPTLAAAEGYLSDPLYRKVDAKYREAAYDRLQTCLVAPSQTS